MYQIDGDSRPENRGLRMPRIPVLRMFCVDGLFWRRVERPRANEGVSSLPASSTAIVTRRTYCWSAQHQHATETVGLSERTERTLAGHSPVQSR